MACCCEALSGPTPKKVFAICFAVSCGERLGFFILSSIPTPASQSPAAASRRAFADSHQTLIETSDSSKPRQAQSRHAIAY